MKRKRIIRACLLVILMTGFLTGCKTNEDAEATRRTEPQITASEIDSLVKALKADVAKPPSGRIFNDDLLDAVARYDVEKVKTLLDAGHDANAEDDQGNSALILASYGEGKIALALAYGGGPVDHGAYFSAENLKAVDCVRLLLAHKANPNHESVLGITALHYAIRNKQDMIERLLRAAGATNEGGLLLPKTRGGSSVVN